MATVVGSLKSVNSTHNSGAVLVGDIGGTNARFGWRSKPGAHISHAKSLPTRDFPSLESAIERYLASERLSQPEKFAFGVASPITSDEFQMTNHPWHISLPKLRSMLGTHDGVLINDFVALASAVPTLTSTELHKIGCGTARADSPIAVIGPGTGLGVATLVPVAHGGFRAIAGEGGHVTLAATNEREAAVISVLRSTFGHVSAERAVSGPGLVALYEALCALAGKPIIKRTPAEVAAHAMAHSDPECDEAVDLLTAFLGNVAGNLALTTGSFGGLYIGGGVIPRLQARFNEQLFRDSFEFKGRFSGYLREIPTYLLIGDSPGLIGAANYLEQHFGSP